MRDDITIRRAQSVADYQACQTAQRAAWGIGDDSYVVPVATLVGAQLHGGLVLGAFLPDGQAVGLSFAFLGKVERRLCLYSQLTGVIPGYQDRGLGSRLKHAQREVARAEDIACIAWAFDPFQAGNARFNIAKLGATAGQYVVNMYGPRSDALNKNTPTDRLIAVWETENAPRPKPPGDPYALIGTSNPKAPRVVEAPPGETVLFLEVPEAVQTLRANAPELADRWTLAVRAAFLQAFGRGYRAIGFVSRPTGGGPRWGYLLARGVHGG